MIFHLGTTNPYKIKEFYSILNALRLQMQVTDPIDPEETESDFAGNALLKAVEYAAHVRGQLLPDYVRRLGSEEQALAVMLHERILTVSEDSGICVAALNDLPGPWSARFSDFAGMDVERGVLTGYRDSGRGRDQIDAANNRRLMELMQDVPAERRVAKFVAALTVVDIDGQILFQSTGESYGWIAEQLRGDEGFGYDPCFVHCRMPETTFAEIDAARKNLFSHRRRVLNDFQAWLGRELKRDDR